MLRVKQTIPNPTRMGWVNKQNTVTVEYIPQDYGKVSYWLADKRFNRKAIRGKDIYYWDTRYRWEPYLRKKLDIAFIFHVINDHEGNAEIPAEAKWFKKLWALYGPELTYMAQETVKDTPVAWQKELFLYGDPYAYAYKAKWIDSTFEIAQSKTLYHGISISEYAEIGEAIKTAIDTEFKAYLRREKARFKKLGVNTKTAVKTPKEPEPEQPQSRIDKIPVWLITTSVLFTVFAISMGYIVYAAGRGLGDDILSSLGTALFGFLLLEVPFAIVIGTILVIKRFLKRKND